MPKQKASRSFADDLAGVMAPVSSGGTFASDLAGVLGGLPPIDVRQVGAEFGDLAQTVVGKEQARTVWTPGAAPPPPTEAPLPPSDFEQTPPYPTDVLPQPQRTFTEDLAGVQTPVPRFNPQTGEALPPEVDEFYDYEAATAAGAQPDASGHWPSEFKKPGHPNEVVGGFNTRTGERVPGTPRLSETELVAQGWSPESAKQLAATPEPPASGETATRVLKDWGITAANAFLSIPETFIGLQSLSTFGMAGKAYDQIGLKPTDWKAYLQQFYSPERKAKLAYVHDAKGMVDTAVRALQNPSVIAHAVAESLPSMYMGGRVGRGLIGLSGKLTAQGGAIASTKVGSKILGLLQNPAVAGGLGEGVVSAGQQAEQVRAQSPEGWLTPGQVALAAGSGFLTGTIGAVSGRLAQALGIADVNTMLAGGLLNPTARRNLARALVLGGIQEGNEEFWQSAQEQIAQNIATGKDPWDNVGEQAVLGALAGVVMSGGGQIIQQGAAIRDERKVGKTIEGIVEQPLTDTRPRLVRPVESPSQLRADDATLRGQIDPISSALEQVLGEPAPTAPTKTRPDWSQQQDIEADADTRVRTAQVIEDLLRRGELAPLVALDPELRKAAKLVQRGSPMLPVQIAVLPDGAIVTENHGTADEEEWAIARENTPTGPTLLAYSSTGTIQELAVRGRAGKDLGRLLQNIVAGTAVVNRPPEAPPAAPAGPAAPVEPGPGPAPEMAPQVPPESAAPVPATELTDEELLRQMQAVMEGTTPAVTPPVTPTATAPMTPVVAPAGPAATGLTRKEESQLKKLGYTPEQVAALPPEEARALIAEAAAKAAPPAPATPAAPAAPTAAVDPLVAALSNAAQGLIDAANALKGQPAPVAEPAAPPPPPPPAAVAPPVAAPPVPPAAEPPAATPKAAPPPIDLLERITALRRHIAKLKRKGMIDTAAETALAQAEREYAAQEGAPRGTATLEPRSVTRPGKHHAPVEKAGPVQRPRRPVRSPTAERDAETQAIHEDELRQAREDGLAPEDEAAFLELLDAHLALGRSWLEDQADVESEYGPEAFLHAVRRLGGIGYDRNWDEAGEIAWFWGKEGKGAVLRGASKAIGKVPRVFINGHDEGADAFMKYGLRLDEMAKRLRQDPRFADIAGPAELLQKLAWAANPNSKEAPGDLRGASQLNERDWWRAPLGYAPAEDVVEPKGPDEYTDEELRPLWEVAKTLTPADDWPQNDVDRWNAIIAEGSRRGWDNPPPPPPVAGEPEASPEEAAKILEEAAKQLQQQPTFEAPFALTGKGKASSTPAAPTPGLFEPTVQEQIDELRKTREDLYKKLGNEWGTLSMGFNPEVAKIAVQLMRNYAKEGYVRFTDVVGRLLHDLGRNKVAVLADYLNTAWKIVHKETVDTLETLKTAKPLPPKTAPTAPAPVVPETPVSVVRGKIQGLSAVDQKVLDDHGLTVQVGPGGSILLTGRTYDLQPKLKDLGAKLSALGRIQVWELTPDRFRELLTHVSGLPVPKGRPALPKAYWTTDSRLTRLRTDAEGRADNSAVAGDPRRDLLPDVVRLIDEGGKKRKIPQFILDEQLEDAYRIATAYNAKRPMFMLASEPGSGKTFVLGAAIREMQEMGAESITYVTVNQALIAQFKRDLKKFNIDNVNFFSYDQLRKAHPHPTDVLILDESHKAKNVAGNVATAVKVQEWMKLSTFTVFSSATPYEDPTQMRYLTNTGVFKQEFSDFESFAFAFGASPLVKPKKGTRDEVQKLKPFWGPTRTSEADAAAARAWLAKTGMFTSRKIRLPEGRVDSRLVKVDAPVHEALVYDGIVQAAAAVEARQAITGLEHAWMINFQKRLLEASKVQQAIKEAQSALDRKRFPVIFVETKAERNYNIPEIIEKDRDYQEMAAAYRAQKLDPPPRPKWKRTNDDKVPLPPEGIVVILREFMQREGQEEINIPPVEDVIMAHFGRDKVAVYTGSVDETPAEQNLEDWRKGRKPILVVTMAKGGTGLSLHDIEGDHPTTQINLNLPWTGSSVLQVSQRTARYGLASNAEIEWLFADNILMDRILASRVGKRMSSLGATVHGLPSVAAGQVEDWNLDDAPFSDIARLNKMMSEQELADQEAAGVEDGELATMGEEEYPAVAPRGPGVPPPQLFGLPARAPTGEDLTTIPIPEAVEFVERLLGEGHIKIVRKFRGAGTLGSFNPNPAKYGIKLRADLFQKGRERELATALLHEIGHMTDWLPDQYIKRGNLLGRLLSVSSVFRDHHFTRPDGTTVALDDVRDELIRLSAQWRPWNRAASSPSFIKYRDSAVELYADALSALYNSPGLVQREAPIFYREFFTYLERKPEVKAAYFDIQARLTGDPESVLAHHQNRVETMNDVGNTMAVDLQRRRIEAAKQMQRDWWMHLRSDLVDRDVPLQDMVRADSKSGQHVSPDQNPTFASEERRQVPGKQKRWAELYVQPVYEGIQALEIPHEQLGAALMYERIALDPKRSELANPLGTTPERALAAYDRMQRMWGPEKTREVKRLIDLFRSGLREMLEDAYTRGELYTDKQMAEMRDNPAYATYRVLDYLAESVSAELYHQIGTFKSIQNPFDATVAKALVTIRATEDMYTRRLMDDFLQQPQHRDAIEDAESYYAGPGMPRRFKAPTADAKLRGHTELVLLKRKGHWEGRYVDPYIARSWNAWTVDRRNMMLSVLRFANSKFFRPLFITYNIGFQAYNLFRDFYRYWKNIPTMTLGRAFKRYYQALDVAKVRAFGLPATPTARQLAAQQFIHEAEQVGILGITYNELHDAHTLADEHIENLLAAAHVPGYGKQPITHPLLRPLLGVLNTIKATGDLIETLPKAAGIIEFLGDGSIADIPADKRSFIRRKVGSPDFTTAGYYKPITNEVLLFSNAIAQAVRSDFEVMTDPTTRTGYWFKTVSVNLIPKLFMAAAAAGLMGEALRRMFAGVSEYNKTNYVVIPLHEDAKGNVTALKIPQDDMGRLLGGILWKGLQMARGRADAIETLQQVADYTGGQIPSVSPLFGLVKSTGTYALGGNPVDTFRGRNVLSDQEQIARGWPAFKKFVGWEFQQVGGNILYKFYYNEPFPRQQTWGQRIVNLPLTGNLVGRFVTIGQQGRAEEVRAAGKGPGREEAQRGLAEKDAVFTLMRERQRRGLGAGNAEALAAQLARQLYPNDRALQRDRQDNIKSRVAMGLKRGEADVFADAVMNAGSVAQKVAALQEVRRQKGIAAFPTWLRHARQSGIVSDPVYQAYQRSLVK